VITDRLDVERSRYPEGPGKRPASLSGTQAFRSGMEPRSTPGKPTFGIGYYRPIHDHYAQQLGGQRRGAATHACSDGAETHGDRLTTVNHEPVYLLEVGPPNRISGLAGLRIAVTDSS
jgi:hypothetical protein